MRIKNKNQTKPENKTSAITLTSQILNPSRDFSHLTHDQVHEAVGFATLTLKVASWWAVPGEGDATRDEQP